MSERTPTPWTIAPGVYDTSPETASEFPHGPEIIGVGGNSVASCNMFGEADAAFICKAVNSHDALVKALHSLTNEVRGVFDAFEYGIRQEISNTNFAVVCDKLEEAYRMLETIKERA